MDLTTLGLEFRI